MKPRLFTSNFKIYTKRILAFLLALIVFYAAAQVSAIALAAHYNDRNVTQRITSYQISDFYALPENSVDVLVLGSSHAMCSYDPAWVKYEFDMEMFNLGTALQQPDTAYYLLREVLKTQKPKYLIYDVYFKVLLEEYSKEQAVTILKELKPSTNAFSMLWNTLKFNDCLDFYNNYLNPFGRIESIMSSSDNEEEEERADNYRGNGFYSTRNSITSEMVAPENHPFSKEYEEFHPRQIEYLKKLIALAQENDIEVALTIAPLPPTIFNRIEYYDKITGAVQEIADEFQIPFIDFATSSSEILWDSDFADQGHLNRDGCARFMEHFVSVMKEHW